MSEYLYGFIFGFAAGYISFYIVDYVQRIATRNKIMRRLKMLEDLMMEITVVHDGKEYKISSKEGESEN